MWPATHPLLLPSMLAEPVLRVAAVAGLHAASRVLGLLAVVPVGESLLAAIAAAVADRSHRRTGPGCAGLARLCLGPGALVVGVVDLQGAGQKTSG